MKAQAPTMAILRAVAEELATEIESERCRPAARSAARRLLMEAYLMASSPGRARKALAMDMARKLDAALVEIRGAAPLGWSPNPVRIRFPIRVQTASDGAMVARIDGFERSLSGLVRRTDAMVRHAEDAAGSREKAPAGRGATPRIPDKDSREVLELVWGESER